MIELIRDIRIRSFGFWQSEICNEVREILHSFECQFVELICDGRTSHVSGIGNIPTDGDSYFAVLKVKQFAFPAEVQIGDKIDAWCSAKYSASNLAFSWLKDDRPIQSNANGILVENSHHFAALIISSLQIEHLGNYTCVASSPTGEQDRYTAELIARTPPTWLSKPNDINASVGSHVEFTCDATGFPRPNVTWLRAGEAFTHFYSLFCLTLFSIPPKSFTLLSSSLSHYFRPLLDTVFAFCFWF